MGFDGSGTYTRTNGTLSGSNLWQQRATQANPVISATEHDGEMNDVASALTACIKANGSKAASGNQPMAGFKHTGVGDATAVDQYVTYGQVTSTGVPNVISSGNVGVGTTSPQTKLHITGAVPSPTAAASAKGTVQIDEASITALTQAGGLEFKSSFSNSGYGSRIVGFDDGTLVTARRVNSATWSESMRITNTGNLLFGTATDDSFPLITQEYFYKASGFHQLKVATDQIANTEYASVTAQAKVGSATRTAQLYVYKHSGINDPCGAVRIQREAGDFDNLWHDQFGNLRTSTSESNIGTTGGTVVGTQTSDERLKEAITPLSYGLAELKQLQPKSFCYTVAPEVAQIGFIAQQVQPIIPEAVYDTKEVIPGEVEAETKLAMDYSKLIPVLVNAVKELSAKVEALEAEVIALKGA